jgi:hypothetical protein
MFKDKCHEHPWLTELTVEVAPVLRHLGATEKINVDP